MSVRSIPLTCLAILAMSTCTWAQTEDFVFSGTLLESSNPLMFGLSVEGTGSIELGTTPDYVLNYNDASAVGQYAEWNDGGFSINVLTQSGYSAGTNVDAGITIASISDLPVYGTTPLVSGKIASFYDDGLIRKLVQIISIDNTKVGDGVAEFSDWDPLTDELAYIQIEEKNHVTQEYNYAIYSLDTFGPPNIFVDGVDSGVRDFLVDGQLLSLLLDDIAAHAKNHGDYVSKVARLLNKLVKQGLLSKKDREHLMELVEHSSIGKPGTHCSSHRSGSNRPEHSHH